MEDDYHLRLDRSLLSVLSHLESFEECASVDVMPSEGCSAFDITNWEKKNVPYVLPADLKAFYSQFNGINVGYKVDIAGKQVTVGEMKLNKLDSISRIALEGTFPKMNWSRYGSSGGNSSSSNSNSSNGGNAESYVLDFNTSAAFTLDSSLEIGQVVLLYRSPDDSGKGDSKLRGNTVNPYEEPEVWFQDISARWHFVSATFSNFLRLLLAHMGVFGWQMAYTPEGLPAETIHWMGLFCKERICVALSAGVSPMR